MAIFRLDERAGQVVSMTSRQSNNMFNFPFNPLRHEGGSVQSKTQDSDEVVISSEGELMYELSKLVNLLGEVRSVRESKITEAKKRLEKKPTVTTRLAKIMLRLLQSNAIPKTGCA